MKVCQKCNRLNPDNADICMGCRSSISHVSTTDQRGVKDSVDQLIKEGLLSTESAKEMRHDADRIVKVPDLSATYQDPVFSCFLYDASGSMSVCREDVIASQPIMLDALRGSAKCRHRALFVAQYLFSHNSKQLHGFRLLAQAPETDDVKILDRSLYDPNGGTALYKTLYSILQDMVVIIESCSSNGLSPQFTIGLITDGEDTEKGVSPDSIQKIIQDLRARRILRSAVIIGLVNNQLSNDRLEQIKRAIGFDQAIPCSQETARDIRRAFVLASQSAVGA